jgi:hypothetical protein
MMACMKILAKASNYRGPLRDKTKDQITAYARNPNPTKQDWEDIAHVVIRAGSLRAATVWQAVVALDPTFQKSIPSGAGNDAELRWQKVPSGFTVALAIKTALDKE